MPDTLRQRQRKHRVRSGLIGDLGGELLNKIWSIVEADHGTTPRQRQLRRRANTELRLPSGLELNGDVIARVWYYVEKRMAAAAQSGRRKLKVAFFYMTRRNRVHPGPGVQDMGDLDYMDSDWWRNLILPRN